LEGDRIALTGRLLWKNSASMNAFRVGFFTCVFYLNLVVTTLGIGLMAVLTGWIGPRGRVVLGWARLWGRWWLAINGTPVRRVFHPAVDQAPEGGVLYLANHASWFDIPAMLVTAPGQVRFAAKRSLFQIPILGWALHLGGFIPVDRGDRLRAREAFKQGVERLRQGHSVILFPEGTRARKGRLSPFQRGGLVMAVRSGCPVVPVGIRGTHRVLPRERWTVHPQPIEVHFGEPIDPAGVDRQDRKALQAQLRRRIEELAGLQEGRYPGASDREASRGQQESTDEA
jgi:1-acyl-sn-glycerol-3-phosphate acyltransferase